MARKGTHKRKGNEEVVITIGSDKSLYGMGQGDVGFLAKTIQEELRAVDVEMTEECQEIFDQVGKKAASLLRADSPVNPKGKHSGRYAKGWVYEKGKGTYNFHKCAGVVRNKTDPQLTHLLEYGHPLVRNGKVVGNVEAKPHIRNVAEWVFYAIQEEFDKLKL